MNTEWLGDDKYEPDYDHARWCSQCERWDENCVCEELCEHFNNLKEVCSSPGEDVCAFLPRPALPQLDYPVWRLSWSEYAKHIGISI